MPAPTLINLWWRPQPVTERAASR
ncbi:hypothetical protein HaLaN_14309 [Haematococcus lacustris]|uniref:Uncharacterized protein n=1 Tax=Haematococcus lacustris TaxID=44745 RepID=A0A699Z7W6_HAELA|nr:hypothetical protein HaLaN_14309 [Haematococcus lacustris]